MWWRRSYKTACGNVRPQHDEIARAPSMLRRCASPTAARQYLLDSPALGAAAPPLRLGKHLSGTSM
ncbi:hypothetical protein EX530_18210 [Xanthomonas phaseoli]|uniref:hypothetical protein n=1 Tax=Xanthomonas phaseoli TaxID=1985254 RepID=UPI003AFFC4AB